MGNKAVVSVPAGFCRGRQFLVKFGADLEGDRDDSSATGESLNAEGNMGDNIDAKMRGHRPLQPVAPVQCSKYQACGPV